MTSLRRSSAGLFGKLTNFPEIAELAERHEINARLILLDYFRRWTIP